MTKQLFHRALKASLVCCLAVILTGCEELFNMLDNPIQTSLNMATSDVKLAVGDTYQRQATCVSPATIVYASSNAAVATVDANGVVTGVAAGEATITASVAAVDYWTAASVSYKVIVGDGSSSSATPNPGASTPAEMKNTPFTIEALEDGAEVKFFEFNGSVPKAIEYSTDGGATWTAGSTAWPGVSVPLTKAGDKVMFRGDNPSYAQSSGYNNISSTKNFKVYGNIMSLIQKTGFETLTTLPAAYAFRRLFTDNNKLIDASDLLLPAETLTNYCYTYMFYGCANLTAAPKEMPATTLAEYCYSCMFEGCAKLTTVPVELPATVMKVYCYNSMFYGCSSLTTAPKLPATTLAYRCYGFMFDGCTKLNEAWVKADYSVANSECYSMFDGCTTVGVLHTTNSATWSGKTGSLVAENSWTD